MDAKMDEKTEPTKAQAAAETPKQPRIGRRFALGVGIGALVLFVTLLALSYAYPAAQTLRNAPKPTDWSSKMEKLGFALAYYAVRNNGAFPAKLSDLYTQGYARTLSDFDSADMPGKVETPADIDKGIDFIYLLSGKTLGDKYQPALRQNAPDGRVLLIAKRGLEWDDDAKRKDEKAP
jgi:hypothetical protein